MDAFRTWLMFKPSGSDARWVPVRAFDWQWFGDATAPEYLWSLLAGNRGKTDPGSSISSACSSLLPEWASSIEKIVDQWQPIAETAPPPADPWTDPVPAPW
jgi:hypothetical protein